ncbi:MAG TPA: AraC family transcriptional regulator [Planctomycetota bacterium]|nr:AraC family transcriptional regulator [Planctomycetota bacterium]
MQSFELQRFSHIRSKSMVERQESHVHAWHELVLILGGEYAAECDGQRVISRPGTLLYYGSGRRHAWRTTSAGFIEYYLLQFSGPAEPFPESPFFIRDEQGQLLRLFRRIEELSADGSSAKPLLNSYLDVLAHEFCVTARGGSDDWLVRVRSFIYSRLDKPTRLRELARAAGMSPFHFSRKFKARVGVSPVQYLRRVRADAALPLLSGTDLPHKAIAREVGLANERDLYRLFMSEKGVAPSALRERRLQNS